MNKTETKKQINKEFYEFVERVFPQYIIDSSAGDGTVDLIPENGKGDDSISYHQSRHDLCIYNWASDSTKEDEIVMNIFLKHLLEKYEK